jgi:AraC-like DNA-binding protein
MKLCFIDPIPPLRSYIDKFWLYESHSSLAAEKSLIAPNGKPKIIVPFKNEIATTRQGKTTICAEHEICFIGIRDVPVTLCTPEGINGTIGIELTPSGAYKFLKVPFYELTNTLLSFADLYGEKGRMLLRRMIDQENPAKKIELIQSFLMERLKESKHNEVVTYTVNLISARHGMIEVKELERKTGYSKRYLDMLFKEHLGIAPKTFATILRFQRFYKAWSNETRSDPAKLNLYEAYYDQSHFIKEFKRYTGYTPMRFAGLQNDFGKNF